MHKADRVTSIIFFALGTAMLIGGYTMDRLPIRQIHPLSIPGLVPMLLGASLAFCSIILFFQSTSEREGDPDANISKGSLLRLSLTVALTLAYALLLVGWLPFLMATAIFIFAFTLVFSWAEALDARARIFMVVKSAIFGAIAAYAIVILFEKAFLVRLP
ncbi:MAG: tripartite tricarboxylate transporter TctB family protein [Paracoccaceae bacterium]